MDNPYSSAERATMGQQFRGGFVSSYDPDTRIYDVNIDIKGSTFCKQLDTGLLSPYGENCRVIVGKFQGTEWVILGEVPRSTSTPQTEANSEEETLARGRGAIQQITSNSEAEAKSYRPIDSSGESSPPVFSGDVRIENRAVRAVTRSFIQLFKFGDILHQASSACFIHLAKLRSTIILKCRNFRQISFGYRKDVVTPSKGEAKNRTTVVEEFRANPLSTESDLVVRSGYLGSNGGDLVLGTETKFKDGFTHLDLTSNTLRSQLGECTFLVGGLSSSLPDGTIQLLQSDNGRGISIQTSENFISLKDDGKEIIISQPNSQVFIKLTDSELALERQGQSFIFDSSGLTITADNLKIDVGGITEINSGAAMSLKAATIDLN